MKHALTHSILALGLLAACGESGSEPKAQVDPTIVATWLEGAPPQPQQLRLEEVDRALSSLPVAERPAPEELTGEWAADFVRDLVAQRWLFAKAARTGFASDPELRAALAESRRNLAWQRLVQEASSRVAAVTDAEIRQEYEWRLRDHLQPERRAVYHLFLRDEPKRRTEAVRGELEELRARALAGESFAQLAREHSQSESRHNDGLMGTVAREDVVPALAEVIFNLPARVPSEPLITAEGGHLFWVELILRDSAPNLEQARPALVTLIEKRKAAEAVEAAARALPEPASYFVATPTELAGLLESGDPESVVLRNGDYQLFLWRLSLEVQEEAGATLGVDRMIAKLRQFDFRERRYQQAEEEGLFESRAVRERLDTVEKRETLRILRGRELLRLPSPEELEEFYADEAARFASPLAFRLARLTVPLSASSTNAAAMARLEAARPELNAGRLDLAMLAAELGGSVDVLGWLPMAQILEQRPQAARLVSGLVAGEHSPPYRYRDTLELLRVEERRDPERPALSSVLEQVRQAYLEKREQQLYRRWITSVSIELQLSVFEPRLADLGMASLEARQGVRQHSGEDEMPVADD